MHLICKTLQRFFTSSQASSLLLLLATLLALLIANSMLAPYYHAFWHQHFLHLSLETWVNDGLMAVFFLLIGLELKKELLIGELSSLNHALLPTIAAVGGMLVPAWIFWQFNQGTPYQAGVGIPMATDIAFALGMLSVLGARVPASLKVFLVTLAVMDDLGAAVMIAVFYAASLSLDFLAAALVVLAALYLLNRLRVRSLLPYLLGGAAMWWLTLQSGVHPTLAGIALAFVIPFGRAHSSASHVLEKALQWPVAFLILPVFAFANTGLQITPQSLPALFSHPYSFGIIISLLLGKPVGITLAAWLAVLTRICTLPHPLRWGHIAGVGMLGGIGFTMSIFITNLAFSGQDEVIQLAKMAILAGSFFSAMAGWLWLKAVLPASQTT